MKKSVIFSAIACVLSAVVSVNAQHQQQPLEKTNGVVAADSISTTAVLSLNSFDDLKNAIENHELTMVKFFSPNCSYCKTLAPEYEAAANTIKESGDNTKVLAELDCTQHRNICRKYQVNAYPTLQVFRKGQPIDIYNQERTSQRIVEYMNTRASTGVEFVHSEDELNQLREKERLLAVAYADLDDKEMIERWSALSDKLIDDFAFALVDMKKINQFGTDIPIVGSSPVVTLMKDFDNSVDVYDGNLSDIAQMEDFLKVNSVPLMGDVNPDTFMDYVDAGRPLVYLFSDSDEMKAQLTEQLKPLAEKYKGVYTFAHIDAKVFGSQASFLGIDTRTLPAISIHDFKTGGRFPYTIPTDDQVSTTADSLITEATYNDFDKFLQKVKNGQVHELIKSQDIPDPDSNDNAPVKTVVGKEFKKIVLDPTKDVLIEVYAPWCPHCQRLAPIYQQLGEVLQKANEEDDTGIVIAKMDGSTNDVPLAAGFQVKGYPTIKFFKAETNELIDYTGPRSLTDFVDFLTKHASKQDLNIDLDSLQGTNNNENNTSYREEL